MEKTIAEIDAALVLIEGEGYATGEGNLTDDRNWHEARRLLKNLSEKAKLLNANPAMSHGLRAPPVASGDVQ